MLHVIFKDFPPEPPANILNHFLIQVAVLLLKPPHGIFRSETAVSLRNRFGSEAVVIYGGPKSWVPFTVYRTIKRDGCPSQGRK